MHVTLNINKVIENTITSDWIIKKYSQIPDLSFSPQIEAIFVFYQIFFTRSTKKPVTMQL